MKHLFLIFLTASLLLFITTASGMLFFGMHEGMGGASTEMPNLDCVSHCLATITSFANTATPLSIVFATVILLFIFSFSEWFTMVDFTSNDFSRFREHIRKFLLHQNLATIMLRN